MNPNFAILDHNRLSLLVYLPWWKEGILHGMTLQGLSFTGNAPGDSVARLCSATGLTKVVAPQQVHGSAIFDAHPPEALGPILKRPGAFQRCGEYDAVIASHDQPSILERVAYGVLTADCVPILVRGDRLWGVVHAGWRGLANGIISKVARAIGSVREAAIFASAGCSAYEVGPEVIEAIGPSAVHVVSDGSRITLDTAETAVRQLLTFLPRERLGVSAICTITDKRFHSHRRDRELAGRALTFVSPSSPVS